MSTTEQSTATSSGSARNSATSTASSTPSRPSTASDTGTTKPEGSGKRGDGFRAFARSRIARIIFIWNFAGLFVLILGVLLLTEMRAGLTEAQFRNLRTQGELITNLLVETGTLEGDPVPYINDTAVRAVLHRILPPVAEGARPGVVGRPRVRMFDDAKGLVADSDILYDSLEERPLPDIGERPTLRESISEYASRVEYLRLTPWNPTITLEEEINRALRGEIAMGERLNEKGERVVSVTLPVRRVQAVVGAITIESADVERILVAERASMIPFVLGATIAIFLSSLLLALFIARPLRRLAAAADSLRLSGSTRLSLPDVSRRRDEIGALGHSLEAMTGALADRIDANERFAADVSHEIKNPLASIQSAVTSAQNAANPDQQKQMLAIVAKDVQRLDRLITDIARASRIEAETARLDLDRVDLGALLYELSRAYAPDPDETDPVHVVFKGIRPEGMLVLGQAGPLGQVFRNLIDNARSFSPEGGIVTVSTEIVRGKEGAIVRATIEDQGPGIPPENLETVFERFYTQRPKGAAFGNNSGLGLSIARQIVAAHQGRIYAQNLDGLGIGERGGARLIVELPLAGPQRA